MSCLDPESKIRKSGDGLPHWQQGKVMPFVTFRLEDSLPRSLMDDWAEQRSRWLLENPEPWTDDVRAEYHRKFSRQFERWLDQGMGACLFADSDARKVLTDCLMRFEGERVMHQAWVIMPNHVHLLFSPRVPLEKLIQGWKSHSARTLGRGPIWQRDYYDTMIRDSNHFANALRYIRRNPLKGKLPEGKYTLWEKNGGQNIHST